MPSSRSLSRWLSLGEFLQQLFELFVKRLSKCLRELSQPVTDVGEVELCLFQYYCSDVFKISRTMGEHCVHDQVFGRGKSNRRLPDRNSDSAADGMLFVGAVGKNEVNTNSCCRVLAWQHHGLFGEGLRVG